MDALTSEREKHSTKDGSSYKTLSKALAFGGVIVVVVGHLNWTL